MGLQRRGLVEALRAELLDDPVGVVLVPGGDEREDDLRQVLVQRKSQFDFPEKDLLFKKADYFFNDVIDIHCIVGDIHSPGEPEQPVSYGPAAVDAFKYPVYKREKLVPLFPRVRGSLKQVFHQPRLFIYYGERIIDFVRHSGCQPSD